MSQSQHPQQPDPQLPPQPPAGGSVTDPEAVLATPPSVRDVSDEIAAPPRRKLPVPTLVLSGLVIAALGFTGGLFVGKDSSSGSKNSAGSGQFPGRGQGGYGPGGRSGEGGFGGQNGGGQSGGQGAPGGTAGNFTAGTITGISGDTVTVKDMSGQTVKIKIGGSTTIKVTKDGKTTDLKSGQSIVVRGTKGSDGTLTAKSVTEGGTGLGGFGGMRGGTGTSGGSNS